MKTDKIQRGALVVLEGCDRVGKSTQAKLLVTALKNLGIPAEFRGFPDRSTSIGSIINEFLSNKKDTKQEAVHLLFSANRWECSNEMKTALENGTTLVVDRYAASGAAYTSAVTNRCLNWCKEADRGLLAPDFVALLTVNEETLSSRPGWANERFERLDIQQKVSKNFIKLKEDTWHVIESGQSIDEIHQELLTRALKVIENVKQKPINELYNNE